MSLRHLHFQAGDKPRDLDLLEQTLDAAGAKLTRHDDGIHAAELLDANEGQIRGAIQGFGYNVLTPETHKQADRISTDRWDPKG